MIARLHDDVAKVLAAPDVRKELITPRAPRRAPARPRSSARFIADEQAKWSKLMKEAGIVVE